MIRDFVVSFLLGSLLTQPISDSPGKPEFKLPDYDRFATTRHFQVDIDANSIKVDWSLTNQEIRTVDFRGKFIPHSPRKTFVGRDDYEVSYFINEVRVECDTSFVSISAIRYYDKDNSLITVSPYAGPLAKWQDFGLRETNMFIKAFCTYRHKLTTPLQV